MGEREKIFPAKCMLCYMVLFFLFFASLRFSRWQEGKDEGESVRKGGRRGTVAWFKFQVSNESVPAVLRSKFLIVWICVSMARARYSAENFRSHFFFPIEKFNLNFSK